MIRRLFIMEMNLTKGLSYQITEHSEDLFEMIPLTTYFLQENGSPSPLQPEYQYINANLTTNVNAHANPIGKRVQHDRKKPQRRQLVHPSPGTPSPNLLG